MTRLQRGSQDLGGLSICMFSQDQLCSCCPLGPPPPISPRSPASPEKIITVVTVSEGSLQSHRYSGEPSGHKPQLERRQNWSVPMTPSLSLSFLICKVGPIIVLILQGCPEEYIMHIKLLKQGRHRVTVPQMRTFVLLLLIITILP